MKTMKIFKAFYIKRRKKKTAKRVAYLQQKDEKMGNTS